MIDAMAALQDKLRNEIRQLEAMAGGERSGDFAGVFLKRCEFLREILLALDAMVRLQADLTTMDGVSLDRQIACIKREIALRERAYPRWIEAGRMRAIEAEKEVTTMKAVLHTLMALEAK